MRIKALLSWESLSNAAPVSLGEGLLALEPLHRRAFQLAI